MFTVELYASIRRAVMIEGMSLREAAQRLGVHRNTIQEHHYSVPTRCASGMARGCLRHSFLLSGARVVGLFG